PCGSSGVAVKKRSRTASRVSLRDSARRSPELLRWVTYVAFSCTRAGRCGFLAHSTVLCFIRFSRRRLDLQLLASAAAALVDESCGEQAR
ncbi:hypothetical protein EJB05_49009, partial [Eragrostis curvula]